MYSTKITKWFKKDKNIKIKKKNKKIIIENNTNSELKIFSKPIIRYNHRYMNFEFKGKIVDGTGAKIAFLTRKRKIDYSAPINTKSSSLKPTRRFLIPAIIIAPNSKVEIESVSYSFTEEPDNLYTKFLGSGDVLVISPLYPSPDNLYACGFVHSRVKSYVDSGLKVDVAVVNAYNESTSYTFEGINVYKTGFDNMRDILMSKNYKAIFVHFYDSKYAKILDTSYLNDTPIFLWNHGADVLYCDAKDLYTPYFEDKYVLPKKLKKEYTERGKYIASHAKDLNYNWIFVSEWEKERAEEFHKTKFNNSVVIPNIIDEKTFGFNKKTKDHRKKIFMLRKWDNSKKYAVDTSILTILELSRRSFFNDLEFYVCGEGNYYHELVEPIKNFDNVHFINKFLSHEEIANIQKECGIALFPTRWDTQGVSALEAASSGLVTLTTDLPVIREFFNCEEQILSPINDFVEIANKVEYFYNNPDEFLKVSSNLSKYVNEKCSYDNTIKKEIEYYEKHKLNPEKVIGEIKDISDKPLLTITIPSYKAEKYLDRCLLSILKSKNKEKLEILVINDGSPDSTKEIGKYYEKITTKNKKSIVKLIDKENGGHGSGINKGIELARGKYFRVIDSDDWIDTAEFDKYFASLEKSDSDLIFTDYCEARTFEDKPLVKDCYSFMEPNIRYNFEDICKSNKYGFREWGPSLPTTTYKTQLLKDANFKLLEKTFYVDMLYNAYSILLADTVERVDANIYRYYIGNVGQSVSTAGWKRNYEHHQRVIFELMNIVTNDKRFTPQKKEYVLHKLLLPMVGTQYYILLDLFHSKKKFMKFEKEIKKYPDIIKYPQFNTRWVKMYRRSFGLLLFLHPVFRKIRNRIGR